MERSEINNLETMKRNIVVMALLLLAWTQAWAQKERAGGYSPVFCPTMKSELPDDVRETSGLFFHGGKLWTHNDSGGKPVLYGIDTVDFRIVQEITLAKVDNKDWEDVCTDGTNVFVGDFGNNKGNRDNLKIYTFPLSAIPDKGDATVNVETIRFRFGDQTELKKRKIHDFDCEALFATDDALYLLSKGWETGTTRLYRLPKTPGNHIAEVVNGFDSQGLVTGADYDPQSGTLVVVGYVKSLHKPFLYLIYGFDEAGERLPHHRFEMPLWPGLQTEGVCFFGGGKCFISAEGTPAYSTRVFLADFRSFISRYLKNK